MSEASKKDGTITLFDDAGKIKNNVSVKGKVVPSAGIVYLNPTPIADAPVIDYEGMANSLRGTQDLIVAQDKPKVESCPFCFGALGHLSRYRIACDNPDCDMCGINTLAKEFLNMDELAKMLVWGGALQIEQRLEEAEYFDAIVEHTGGGCATLYLGDPDSQGYYPLACGPGVYKDYSDFDFSVGEYKELYIGTEDSGERAMEGGLYPGEQKLEPLAKFIVTEYVRLNAWR